MRSSILFFIVFVLVAFSGFAQERHLKNAKGFIDKGSFEKAIDRIVTYEKSVGIKYESIYVRYLLLAKNPPSIVTKDSSLTLLKSANTLFLAEVDEKKKNNLCEELQICGNDLPGLIDSVEVELFELCKVGNVEEQLLWFLKKYPQSKIFNIASKFLNQYAFKEVLKQNTEVAYQTFATKYPHSEEFKIALDSLESIGFQGALQANSVELYNRFLSQYPKSKKLGIVKRKMWDKAFQEAQEIHTKTAYADFIKRFADSDLVLSAQKAIEKLDWEAALQGNQRSLFVLFVKDYPKSTLLKDALLRIEGFDWDLAKKENSRDAFEKFLEKYPQSTKKADALAFIEKFDWEMAKGENTRESYVAYVDKYPDSGNIKQAMASIEKFDWIEASKDGSLQAIQNFLNGYPDGAFASEAKSIMNGLKLVVPYLTSNQKYKLYDASNETFVSESLYDKIEPMDNELFIVTNFGKKGIVNKFGENITLATYDCFVPIAKKGIIFQLGSKFGVMNRMGETIVQPIYDDLDSQGDSLLISYSKRGKLVKMGLLDLKGRVLVDNKFRELVVIGQNQMIVSLDKKIRYLANSAGNFISAPYSDIYESRIVLNKDKYGYLNEQGKLAIPTIYKQIEVVNSGFFIAENIEGKQGVLDSLGRIVIPFDKHVIRYVGIDIYALIRYTNSNNSTVNLYSVSKRRVINTVAFEEVGRFSEGLIDFKLSGKIGYLNTEGKIVIASIYDSFENVSAPYDKDFGGADWVDIFKIEPGDDINEGEYEPEDGEPEDYLVAFCEERAFDEELNIQPLKHYSNKDFSDGIALVNIGNKVGAIDQNGKIIVPITYDYMTPYLHGHAVGVIKIAEEKFRPVILNKVGQVILEDYVIDTRFSSDKLIVKNRQGEYFELALDGTMNKKLLGKDFSYIQRFKEYIKFQYKDASIYATSEFVWYSDENIDFSKFEAQKSIQSGVSLRISKEYEKAIIEFKKALRISPNNVNALIGIAETYLDENDHYNAIKYVDQALQVASGPIKFTALELKFNIYKDQSNWSEAIDIASQIVSQFADVRYDWYYERSLCKYELQRYSDAIDDITLALQGAFTSSKSYIYNLRGVCYSRLNMDNYALLDFKQATIYGIKESDDETSMGLYFNNLGNTSLSLKKKDEAQVAFKKAASYGNQDAARTLRSSIFRK
jgi:tetratricopeptide (TPR) repeat protein